MKFTILSEEKKVTVSDGRRMSISGLARYWMEILSCGYRIVKSRGGYVNRDGSYIHEQSYELTVDSEMGMLSKLKLLARCIARLADQEEVWLQYRGHTEKINKETKLSRR